MVFRRSSPFFIALHRKNGSDLSSWAAIEVDHQQLPLQQDVEELVGHSEAQHGLRDRQAEVDALGRGFLDLEAFGHRFWSKNDELYGICL